MYTKPIGCVVFLILVSLVAFGQSPSVNTGFDVVAIKRDTIPANGASTPPLQGGRLDFTNVTIKDILSLAYYPIDVLHIYGGPAWIGTERYDIQATTSERSVSEERYHQMLQMMLADRFKLTVHQETRQEPIYALIPDKKGIKLKATPQSACTPASPEVTLQPNGTPCGQRYSWNETRLEGVGMTTTTLARFLGLVAGRPVIDRSGYVGMADIKLDFTPPYKDSSDPAAPPSIFTALPEQLGLRLQPERGPVDVLIIDRVERPSDN